MRQQRTTCCRFMSPHVVTTCRWSHDFEPECRRQQQMESSWFHVFREARCLTCSRIYSDRNFLYLLLEEDDDDLFLLHLYRKRREAIRPMLKCRTSERTYSILIKNHLESDIKEFREYCRLSKKQFDFILSLIREEIEAKKINAINAEEKSFLTLR
ncbi:unnamed protein product [Euphydryas editha]|uniref:Uncharacterized protein n=1 Tax=Euphydryas editha TaxID=104508 RepID=A0AAU9UFF2_EUPED|nr:unnamed protein product [Euphydryas editha]